jgi:hypothetical protein
MQSLHVQKKETSSKGLGQMRASEEGNLLVELLE